MTLERLPADADARDVIVWLRQMVKTIGPGFNLDTPGEDYMPHMTHGEAAAYDADMRRAFDLLAPTGRDAYCVCWKVARRMLGLPIDA